MLIKFTVDGKPYQIDKLTLGDGAVLKRRFGVDNLEEFDPRDPETILGLLTIAISKTDGVSIAEAEAIAEAIDITHVKAEQDASAASDPTPAAEGNAATEPPAAPSPSETTPPQPGVQS